MPRKMVSFNDSMHMKIRAKSFILLIAWFCLFHEPVIGETVTWNLKKKYGEITQKSLSRAIGEAKAHFTESPNDIVVLEFDAGVYPLSAPEDNSKGVIELSGIKPGPQGRLIFRGAGMDKTTLVFDSSKIQIYGKNVYHVSFVGFHITRSHYSVTQGHVIQVSPGVVDLEIQSGFPTPQDIFNPGSKQGRYMRRYTDSRTDRN